MGSSEGAIRLREPMTLQLKSNGTYTLSVMGEAGKFTVDGNEVTLLPQASNDQAGLSADDRTKHLVLSDDGRSLRETDEIGPHAVVEFTKQP